MLSCGFLSSLLLSGGSGGFGFLSIVARACCQNECCKDDVVKAFEDKFKSDDKMTAEESKKKGTKKQHPAGVINKEEGKKNSLKKKKIYTYEKVLRGVRIIEK